MKGDIKTGNTDLVITWIEEIAEKMRVHTPFKGESSQRKADLNMVLPGTEVVETYCKSAQHLVDACP